METTRVLLAKPKRSVHGRGFRYQGGHGGLAYILYSIYCRQLAASYSVKPSVTGAIWHDNAARMPQRNRWWLAGVRRRRRKTHTHYFEINS